ncbi:MAG: glycosyl transferase family 1 [Alphaproteobacteria bacterium]|nr:glycosyl transferase family 1 [Alphaproteobacteria bacterium]
MSGWGLGLRLALRELRGGLKGFFVFLLCIVLGTATITAVQNTSANLQAGLQKDAQSILGGDIKLRQIYNPLPESVKTYLGDRGYALSENVETNSMVRSDGADEDESRSTLAQVKAVDNNYPLYGVLNISDAHGNPLTDPIDNLQAGGTYKAYLDPELLARLNVAVGGIIGLGELDFVVSGIIQNEPDRLGGGRPPIAPRVMVSRDALSKSGLLQPGSMAYHNLLVKLNAEADVGAVRSEIEADFANEDWRIRDRTNAAPSIERFLDRLVLFLTLISLTALLVGGIGIYNAVRAYMTGRLRVIATFKSVGAQRHVILKTYMIQIFLLGSFGLLAGLVTGLLASGIAWPFIRDLLSLSQQFAVWPGALVVAALFGYLTLFLFSAGPVINALDVSPTQLFRDRIDPVKIRITPIYGASMLIFSILLFALVYFVSPDKELAVYFTVGAALTLVFFNYLGVGVVYLFKMLPRFGTGASRIAYTNIIRPGNITSQITLSLGLGLTVLVLVALIEGNFSQAVTGSISKEAPSFFVVDIQKNQLGDFEKLLAQTETVSDVRASANIRGRIKSVNGVPAEEAIISDENRWLLSNDRGLTYTAEIPEHSEILEGEWWEPDYDGPPLVSVVEDVREAFGVKPGDTITVDVLGRDITAEIANIRSVNWLNYTISFALTFAPGALENAPQTFLATFRIDPEQESIIQSQISEEFPNITLIRLSEAMETVSNILEKIGIAVRIAAVIALITGIFVLTGAMAAQNERRVYEAVIMKTLGASRKTIITAYLSEYAVLGLLTAIAATAIASLGAWALVTKILELEWTFLPGTLVSTAIIALIITVILGGIGTLRALNHSVASYLRNE